MSQELQQKSTDGRTFAFLSLVGWIIPIIGLPLAILGITKSVKNDDSLGLIVGVFGLLLTIFNAFVGFMNGVGGG